MARDTKEKILEAALDVFSKDGYAGANISDIAAQVGIVKSALYRHFDSKAALWNALLDRMDAYYKERFGSVDTLPPIPQSTQELLALTERMLRFTMYDEKIIACRKLLVTEQYRDEKAQRLVGEHFSDGLEALFTVIFGKMAEQGLLEAGDPALAAFAFTAPISSLVQKSDREPEKRDELLAKALRFAGYFIGEHTKQL